MDELQPRRGPGRPPKSETEIAELPPRRPPRRPFGSMQQRLAYPEREGFHRHWFNDVPGRINQALDAGYEHVKNKEGKNISAVVGVAEGGGPLHSFLMEIPEEWYRDDMAAQQAENEQRMAAIKTPRPRIEGADERDQGKFYAGKEGSSVRRGSQR